MFYCQGEDLHSDEVVEFFLEQKELLHKLKVFNKINHWDNLLDISIKTNEVLNSSEYHILHDDACIEILDKIEKKKMN